MNPIRAIVRAIWNFYTAVWTTPTMDERFQRNEAFVPVLIQAFLASVSPLTLYLQEKWVLGIACILPAFIILRTIHQSMMFMNSERVDGEWKLTTSVSGMAMSTAVVSQMILVTLVVAFSVATSMIEH